MLCWILLILGAGARARGRAYVMSTKCLQGSALCRVPEAVDREAAVELPLLVDLGDRARLLAIALK